MRNNRWITIGSVVALVVLLAAGASLTFAQSAAPAPKAPEKTPQIVVVPAPSCDLKDAEAASQEAGDQYQVILGQLNDAEAALEDSEDAMNLSQLENFDDLTANLANLQSDALEQEAEAMAQHKVVVGPGDVEVWGEESSGWLGIEIVEVNAENVKELKLAETRGVVVQSVEADSPAAKAGLKENDVILSYEGEKVEGTIQFRRLVRETPPGRSIPLVISRDGSTQNVTIEVGDRGGAGDKAPKAFKYEFKMPKVHEYSAPDFNFVMPEMMDFHTPVLGIGAEDLSGQLGEYFGAPGGEGILVREVRSGTPAEKAGLKAGDVIVKLDGEAIKSTRDLRNVMRKKADQKSVTLSVLRKGSEISVPVEVEKPRHFDGPQIMSRVQM